MGLRGTNHFEGERLAAETYLILKGLIGLITLVLTTLYFLVRSIR